MPKSNSSSDSKQLPLFFDIHDWPYWVEPQDIVVDVIYEGNPLGKQRPRFGKGGQVYTPSQTKEYEQALSWLMREALRDVEPEGKTRFALRCLFYRNDHRRIDCDNMLKAVSDAANGQVWVDDAQVAEVIGRLFLGHERPHAEILIHRVDDLSPRKESVCEHCGKHFVGYASQHRKFCSSECSNEARRVTNVCQNCGDSYTVPRSTGGKQKFCSRLCSLLFYAKKKSLERGPATWKCEDCGSPVTRREYKVCRGCSMKRRSDPTSNYWLSRHKSP